MVETQNNKVCLHKKEWQQMQFAPVITAAGMFVVNDNANQQRYSLYMTSATVHYLYDHEQDDWIQIPSGAFGGTFGAGACACYGDWSLPFIANGGSTTTVVVPSATYNINGLVVGKTIEFTNNTNIGLRRTITAILNLGGSGNTTLTLDAPVTAVVNTDTFRIASGMFYILSAGTLAATSFRKFDIATMSWTSCTNTGLSAAWATDGRLVYTGILGVSYDTGTAAISSTTTNLDCTGKTWAVDQWINYQVRITGGTGIGQIKVITDSDADTLIMSAGTDLDDTSTFVIEGDENAIYALGNNAVTLYKYSISANTWATVSPTAARAGAPIAGMSADFVGVTGDTGWADITNIKNGRYIYSLRGGTAVIDRYDIPSLAWVATTGLNYLPNLVTFATGDSTDWSGKYIYIAKEGTGLIPQRFYMFSVVDNIMIPLSTDWNLGGAALLGNKIWIKNFSSTGTIKWLYCLQSTSTSLKRIMLF